MSLTENLVIWAEHPFLFSVYLQVVNKELPAMWSSAAEKLKVMKVVLCTGFTRPRKTLCISLSLSLSVSLSVYLSLSVCLSLPPPLSISLGNKELVMTDIWHKLVWRRKRKRLNKNKIVLGRKQILSRMTAGLVFRKKLWKVNFANLLRVQ